MPPEAPNSSTGEAIRHSGRCYCGKTKVTSPHEAEAVAWCHCRDCRRITGAPAAAFAAFADQSLRISPEPEQWISHTPGVERWFCPSCGSPVAARFDYLPGQTYVPLGIMDDAESLAPSLHCHVGSALGWVCISDGLPRQTGSGRAELKK